MRMTSHNINYKISKYLFCYNFQGIIFSKCVFVYLEPRQNERNLLKNILKMFLSYQPSLGPRALLVNIFLSFCHLQWYCRLYIILYIFMILWCHTWLPVVEWPGLLSGVYCLAELDSGFSDKVSFVPIDTGVYYHIPTS